MASTLVTVTSSVKEKHGSRPPHHLNDTKSLFQNPWPSYVNTQRPRLMASFFWKSLVRAPKPGKTVADDLHLQPPTWGEGAKKQDLKATWLGHACFLVELPTPEGSTRGPRILFDPVFSNRCSPFTSLGPARYTKPPVSMDAIPEVDVVVISHNHYDHMDAPTLRSLRERHNPHFFAPLNNDATFASFNIAPTHFHCLDWWEQSLITVELPSSSSNGHDPTTKEPSKRTVQFRLTCTPCQHQTARGLFDRCHSLWSSWAVEELISGGNKSGFKIWFGGDTAYRTVQPGQDEDKAPFCPAFKEIGKKFGSFDLGLIPIGAYNPRPAMSCVHASPSDAVRIFQDIRAKKAIGMHWGTWILTLEPVLEPPKILAEEANKAGLAENAFTVCGLGETVIVEHS